MFNRSLESFRSFAFRSLALGMLGMVAAAAAAAESGAAPGARSILVYGDSLSAAYGIAQERGWVQLLGDRLKREGYDYSVVNASISGETTQGGLSRLASALARHQPAVVILALGANDGLRGLPVAGMKSNLSAMIEQTRKSGATVLLAGMRVPPNYGANYSRTFAATFPELAKQHRIALTPFLLEGIAEKPDLFQPDRLHPTEAAQPIILANIWRGLRPLLKK